MVNIGHSSIYKYNPVSTQHNQWHNRLSTSKDLLRWGIWAYFLLLIFEGSLRKWVLPELATPLLVIRDPIALWLIALSWKKGFLKPNIYLSSMVGVGILSIATALIAGHGSLPVAIYGGRIWLIHFPLIFVIGAILNREDILAIGKFTLWLSIPMVTLLIYQFYSPQTAWVNRGVGGDIEGAGFSGALGYFRAPTTFSFTSGTSLFFGFTAVFVFYSWVHGKIVNKLLLIVVTIGLLLSIPFSISRTLLFHVILSFLFYVAIAIQRPKFIFNILLVFTLGLLAIIFLNDTDFLKTGTEVFASRFDNASNDEGGLEGTLIDRYLGSMINPIVKAFKQPLLGYGVGMGTNAGSALLIGKVEFLIDEVEWGRVIGEVGPIMGVLIIFIRVLLTYDIARLAYKRFKTGDFLPWMLLSIGVVTLPQGQWGQPTILGFSVFIGGLMIAAIRTSVAK